MFESMDATLDRADTALGATSVISNIDRHFEHVNGSVELPARKCSAQRLQHKLACAMSSLLKRSLIKCSSSGSRSGLSSATSDDVELLFLALLAEGTLLLRSSILSGAKQLQKR